jgi:hypothetical protein
MQNRFFIFKGAVSNYFKNNKSMLVTTSVENSLATQTLFLNNTFLVKFFSLGSKNIVEISYKKSSFYYFTEFYKVLILLNLNKFN